MPNCVVITCKNRSENVNRATHGVTYHRFPIVPEVRSAWLKALGRDAWEPKDRSAVCSEHFLAEDLYYTKNGLRKVRNGALPIVLQDSSVYSHGDPAKSKVCRICLSTDSKMFSIKKYKLEHIYEAITGISVTEEDRLPHKLCVECAHRLNNCGKFRNKTLRAHALLMEIIKKQGTLSSQNLKLINRENNRLASTLSCKYYFNDHTDLYIEYNENDIQTDGKIEIDVTPNIQEVNLDENLDIKDETSNNDIFLSENDYQDNLIKNEVDNVVDNVNDNEITELDNNADNHNDIDDDFSSDDSIPLDRRRTKKKLKKKKEEKKDTKERKRQLKKNAVEPKIDRRRKPFLNDDLNETLFTITDLTFEEQVAEILKRQESANYKNAVYKCTECFKGFLDEDAYSGHMTRHTNQCGEFRCDICKTHFKHPHALRKHITAHHTQRFSCNQCPYVTTHRQTARLHERWHKGTKYQCPHCQDEFVKFTTYMGHIRIKHPSDFVCQLCGFSFVSQKGIELHRKLKHRIDTVEIPEDGPYCELCNVKFVNSEAHRQHLRVSARHNTSDKETLESNKPKKGRKTKEAKEREKRLREKNMKDLGERRLYPSQMRKAEGPIPCEQCGLQLEDSRAYHGHFRRMHPDKNRTNYPSMRSPFMCEVCGRMFQSYALLKDHTWVHTGERPFSCDSCGKCFRMKQRLVAHRRVHSQVKASYVCNLCGKHFSTHSNRQRHMFIHTGLKPFKCEMCGKGFKHASEKRAHITYVHLKKPWPKRSRGKRRDARQGSLPPQPMPTSASEMNIPPPLWPQCDQKLDHMNPAMDDKPVYYNLKI